MYKKQRKLIAFQSNTKPSFSANSLVFQINFIYNQSKLFGVVRRLDNRIRDSWEDQDLTQQQVAEALGIIQRKYSYLETGVQQWTDEPLFKLSRYYRVSVDYLLRLTDESKQK